MAAGTSDISPDELVKLLSAHMVIPDGISTQLKKPPLRLILDIAGNLFNSGVGQGFLTHSDFDVDTLKAGGSTARHLVMHKLNAIASMSVAVSLGVPPDASLAASAKQAPMPGGAAGVRRVLAGLAHCAGMAAQRQAQIGQVLADAFGSSTPAAEDTAPVPVAAPIPSIAQPRRAAQPVAVRADTVTTSARAAALLGLPASVPGPARTPARPSTAPSSRPSARPSTAPAQRAHGSTAARSTRMAPSGMLDLHTGSLAALGSARLWQSRPTTPAMLQRGTGGASTAIARPLTAVGTRDTTSSQRLLAEAASQDALLSLLAMSSGARGAQGDMDDHSERHSDAPAPSTRTHCAIRDGHGGWTWAMPAPAANEALLVAAEQGDQTRVAGLLGFRIQQLRGTGSHALTSFSERKGGTPWWRAIARRVPVRTASGRVVLVAGTPPSVARGLQDWTPLHYAARAGHVHAAALLLEAGADVRAVSTAGETPLHVAVRKKGNPVVPLLLAAGTNANAQEEYGETPLFEAIRQKDAGTALRLHLAGASWALRSRLGDSAADVADESCWAVAASLRQRSLACGSAGRASVQRLPLSVLARVVVAAGPECAPQFAGCCAAWAAIIAAIHEDLRRAWPSQRGGSGPASRAARAGSAELAGTAAGRGSALSRPSTAGTCSTDGGWDPDTLTEVVKVRGGRRGGGGLVLDG